ncbi:unnamed protein product [Kuraishia capsulata CBS 1993]|uniref:Major facilitator superfamily (MFS) profile domain-containing protein n=1 Tax=Kuraishia capsulata CBS 1993 TaxID=1382522 RepID=W6MUT7_9ASCO|nr:uncharacterized protein KUCA_T00005519001 [Kuraishia capsulata CBS 1993]CDK29527.1 unnamed protein product [Kuraishia capsulata CBS 1993]
MKEEIEHREVAELDEEDIQSELNEKPEATEEKLSVLEQIKQAKGVLKYMLIIYVGATGVGIDALLFSLLLGDEGFRKRYGYWNEGSQSWVIKAVYQSGWNGGSQGAQIFGSLFSGQMSDVIGRLNTLRVACVIAIAAAIVEITAKTAAILVAGKVIMGLSVGIMITVVPPYLSELSPPNLRGYGAIGINFSMCFGQLLAAITVMACSKSYTDIDDKRSYTVAMAIQFILVSVFLMLSPLLPESPTLLVQKGNLDKAQANIARLYGDTTDYDKEAHFDELVAQVQKETIEHELSKQVSYLEVFKGMNLWRTFLCSVVITGQQWVGMSFVLPYINYFFENAGISSSNEKTVGNFTVAVGGNILSYFILQRFPRRGMFVGGVAFLTVSNLIIGCMTYASSSAAGYVVVVFIFLWSFVYQFSVGANAYAILVEIPSSRLLAKSISIASNVNNLVGFGLGYLIPYLYNPDEVNLGLKIQFVWMATGAVLFFVALAFLPETKGRTASEMDQMFENNVNPLHFDKVKFTVDGDIIHSTVRKGYFTWLKRKPFRSSSSD